MLRRRSSDARFRARHGVTAKLALAALSHGAWRSVVAAGGHGDASPPHVADPARMPDTGETPAERFARAPALAGTPGEAYLARRGIALAIAQQAGLRYDPDWAGRPAVLCGLRDASGRLCAVHGRYLHTLRGQDKMLTVGCAGGVAAVGQGCAAQPAVIVEGVFDALSLAVCGASAVATVGRRAPWLTDALAGHLVWLAFDANQPGDHAAALHARLLDRSVTRRLRPPDGSKDWNTALVKGGGAALARWLRGAFATADGDTSTR